MERENSKTQKVCQTLKTKRIHGVLMLAQFTNNGIDTKIYRKAWVIYLDQKPVSLSMY